MTFCPLIRSAWRRRAGLVDVVQRCLQTFFHAVVVPPIERSPSPARQVHRVPHCWHREWGLRHLVVSSVNSGRDEGSRGSLANHCGRPMCPGGSLHKTNHVSILALIPMARVRRDAPRPAHHCRLDGLQLLCRDWLIPLLPQEPLRIFHLGSQSLDIIKWLFAQLLRLAKRLPGSVHIACHLVRIIRARRARRTGRSRDAGVRDHAVRRLSKEVVAEAFLDQALAASQHTDR